MSEPACRTQTETLSLDEILSEHAQARPGVPLLALGQTVFWDELMKVGVAKALKDQNLPHQFIGGVHDTDFFAKLPNGPRQPGRFVSVPHNDTTTKGLWSAAAEFSTLFGSETVVSRETLVAAGLRVHFLQRFRPEILDAATEAWGWRGVVSLDDKPPITAELPLRQVFPALIDALDEAGQQAVRSLSGESRTRAEAQRRELHRIVCDFADEPNLTLGQLYRQLWPQLAHLITGEHVPMETTATTDLLRFNSATAGQPRFELLDLFLRPETRAIARQAYDDAVRQGSGQYELTKFGTGAIPFDIVIPGLGRGTIRIGERGVVFQTRKLQFLSLRKPIASVHDLAAAVEAKFGPDCVIIGKAISLIGMLAREFTFVFHEGASSYVRVSRQFHNRLREAGIAVELNPILRIRYRAWDSLEHSCAWIQLPEPFRRPFGTEELCSPSFAARWREVAAEQDSFLKTLGQLTRPVELVRWLDKQFGGSWHVLADEYARLHESLRELLARLAELDTERENLYQRRRDLRRRWQQHQEQMGADWRARYGEMNEASLRDPVRQSFQRETERLHHEQRTLRSAFRDLRHRRQSLVSEATWQRVHTRRREIELEAELKRARLIRDAVISSQGLRNANLRPAAWWFPLVSPEGSWFRATIASSECYWEPLIG